MPPTSIHMSRVSADMSIKLRKWKTLRKHSLHGKNSLNRKIAISVLLKLFISGNERCHNTDDPKRMSGILFSNVNNTQSMIPEDQKHMTSTVQAGVTEIRCLSAMYQLTLYNRKGMLSVRRKLLCTCEATNFIF